MSNNSPDGSEVKSKKIKTEVLQEATKKLYELGVAEYVYLDPVALVDKWFDKGWRFSDENKGEALGWHKYPSANLKPIEGPC